MAANAWNQFNAYLENTLRIAEAPARNALRQQGLAAFDDLSALEEDDITKICSNIRKPGGMIPNPVRQGQPPQIPNPGILFGYLYERRLELLRYYVFHCKRIQRPLDPNMMSLVRLQTVYHLKEVEEQLKDVKVPMPECLLKVEDARTRLEDLDDYLMRKRGETGLPLAYVVRMNVGLPDDDADFGMPTPLEEMVERGDHTAAAYTSDNREVWNAVRSLAHGGIAWNWVSEFARSCDGRHAYMALKSHYLGDAFKERILSVADATLSKAFYDGSRNFTFESYTGVLQKAFTDMEGAGEEVAEKRKIRILLSGITAPILQAACCAVRATPRLSEDFAMAVNYLAEQVDVTKAPGTKRNISSVTTGSQSGDKAKSNSNKKGKKEQKGNAKKDGKSPKNIKITDEYYKSDVWWSLTDAQRELVRTKRANRDKRRGVAAIQSTSTSNNTESDKNGEGNNQSNANSSSSASLGATMSRRVHFQNNN